jgi:CRP-like cAMP-binding protein
MVNKKSIHCQDCPAFSKSAFATFAKDELDFLQINKTSFEQKRGDTLNQQGQPVDGAYCMAHGHAKVVWQDQHTESIVKIVSPGDMSGYRCLFSETTYRATATSLGNTLGCFIPKNVFNDLLKKNQSFNSEILKRMGLELRMAEKRLHSFCQKSVRERMAETLLLLKESCGIYQEDKWILEIQITREELSSWVGTAKETVVRCLSDMKDEKVIEQIGPYIALTNVNSLKKISGMAD